MSLGERYGVPQDESVSDERWLREAGERGEAVLMKDARVRYNPAEKAPGVEGQLALDAARLARARAPPPDSVLRLVHQLDDALATSQLGDRAPTPGALRCRRCPASRAATVGENEEVTATEHANTADVSCGG